VERYLAWTATGTLGRFSCTNCAWSHPHPSKQDSPVTLGGAVLKLVQRAFLQHLCVRHPSVRPEEPLHPGLSSEARHGGSTRLQC
jgi:hypothetical protein